MSYAHRLVRLTRKMAIKIDRLINGIELKIQINPHLYGLLIFIKSQEIHPEKKAT